MVTGSRVVVLAGFSHVAEVGTPVGEQARRRHFGAKESEAEYR